jgi:hypothetical protein
MKQLILAFTLLGSVAALAVPQSVAKRSKRNPVLVQVVLMGKATYGYHTTKLSGRTAKEMIKNFFKDEDNVVFGANDITFGDEVSVGTLSNKGLESLLSQFAQPDHFHNGDPNDIENNSERSPFTAEQAEKIVRKAVKALKTTGVTFGYTSSGGYCGVTFAGLVVFDIKNKKAYTITLAPSGPC